MLPAFDCLLRVPVLSEKAIPVPDTASLYLRFFDGVLRLRIGYPKVFLPAVSGATEAPGAHEKNPPVGGRKSEVRLGFLEQDGVIERESAVEGREAVKKWRVRTFPVEDFGDIAVRLSAKDDNLSGEAIYEITALHFLFVS